MIVTALAPSYDFFMFYQTLALTPMLLLSGVFFPITQLPALAQHITLLLPLSHAVELIRPAMLGRPVGNVVLHVGVLVVLFGRAVFHLRGAVQAADDEVKGNERRK